MSREGNGNAPSSAYLTEEEAFDPFDLVDSLTIAYIEGDAWRAARLKAEIIRRLGGKLQEPACKLCGGTGLDAYQFSNIAPKSALRAWIEGVRDEVLMPLAERSRGDLGAIADGFGQESVSLLAALEVPYANHPQWVLGFEAGRKAERK